MVSNMEGVDIERIKRRQFSSEEKERLIASAQKLESYPLHYMNAAGVDIDSLLRTMRVMDDEVVIVDYLGQMIPDEDHKKLSPIVKKLQQYAHEKNKLVILLSQITRTGEAKEPGLADMRQTGEEPSDMILLLHGEREGQVRKMKLGILKNKNGRTGYVHVMFDARYSRYFDEEKREEIEQKNYQENELPF